MTHTNLSILLISAGLLGGCAATIPELVSAREAFQVASDGPAATLVPAELHKAQESLAEAEAEFKSDPRGFHARDLAYVAQRKAELAEALATQAVEGRNQASANSQYQVIQDAIMLHTKDELGATRSDLASAESATASANARLTASEEARVLAEARTAAATEALAKLAAVKEESRGLVITLSGSVLFRSDESKLMAGAQTRLGQVTDALLATKERRLLVEGHTDSQGTEAYNVDLSQRRADAVRQFLIQQGYDSGSIQAVGIGETRPVAENETAEGRANNRRVEIIVEPLAASAMK